MYGIYVQLYGMITSGNGVVHTYEINVQLYGMALPVKQNQDSPRDRIIAATLRLIGDEGIDAVTHRRVAKLAGVSPGTTTHHFSGRAALLRESFIGYLGWGDKLFDNLVSAAEQEEDIDVGGVRRVLVAMIKREFADASLMRAEHELLLHASNDEELAKVVIAWQARAIGGIAALLERAGVQRPTESARTLLNFIRGFELERLLNPRLSVKEFDRRITPLLQGLRGTD